MIQGWITGKRNFMTKRKILIDGYNLGLETGTGVATYARNLTYCTHELGFQTDVLYGTRASPGHQSLMKEIAFYDPYVGDPPAWLKTLRKTVDAATHQAGVMAKAVPMSGRVISTPYKSRMPYFDTIWNSPSIFDRSARHFEMMRAFGPSRLPVRVGDKPDIAHWTYPLPIKVPGAINIYTQWFEYLGPNALSVLGGGVLLVVFGLLLRWLNGRVRKTEPSVAASA